MIERLSTGNEQYIVTIKKQGFYYGIDRCIDGVLVKILQHCAATTLLGLGSFGGHNN